MSTIEAAALATDRLVDMIASPKNSLLGSAVEWTWRSYRFNRCTVFATVLVVAGILATVLFLPFFFVSLLGVGLWYYDWSRQRTFWLERHFSCGFRDLQIRVIVDAKGTCQELQRGNYYSDALLSGRPYKCKFCEFRTFVPAVELS